MTAIPALASEPRPDLAPHHRLAAACRELRAAVHADEKLEVVWRYRELERAMATHLDAEDRVLPTFAERAPLEARRIELEHRDLRDRLFRLGVEVELHRVGAERFEALIQDLENHIQLEEETLYKR